MNVQMNEWMADVDRQYKKKRRTDMQETWLEQFYNEMDAEKRLDILNTNADKTVNASEMANHSADEKNEKDKKRNALTPVSATPFRGGFATMNHPLRQ